jgi:hypothetical protein
MTFAPAEVHAGPLEGVVVVAVENEPDALDLLKDSAGTRRSSGVVRASDAQSALRALRRVRPSVLVSDLSMRQDTTAGG